MVVRQARLLAIVLLLLTAANLCLAQTYPTQFRKISTLSGGFTLPLTPGAQFGIEQAAIGDLDNDGVIDIAVGATNQGGSIVGAVFILFMNSDGSVKHSVQINSIEPPGDFDSFGSSICALGDLDGDGVEDIGVGAGYDSDGGFQTGAFWILFMNTNGTVKNRQKISTLVGGFSGPIDDGHVFGTGAATLGDLDGDGVVDIAVGARIPGAVYILFLNTNGTVKNWSAISSASGLPVDTGGLFGYGVASLGDVDGDGVTDLAIGGHRSDVGFVDSGVVFVVFLTTSGGVKGHTQISAGLSNFNDMSSSILGVGIAGIGDYDNDGVRDMVVGGNDAFGAGAIWYMMLNANGTVKSYHKISGGTGHSGLTLGFGDFFGGSFSFLGDINNDGILDLAIGAFQDDDGAANNGALWITTSACPLVDAGTNRNVCSIQSVMMDATLNSPSVGTWSVVSGSCQFSDIHSKTAIVSNLAIGTNKLRWTVTTPGCVSAFDEVDIVVDLVIKPNAGSDIALCYPATSTPLAGNSSVSGFGTWYLLSGNGIIVDNHDPNTSVINLGVGENIISWDFPSSTYCPAQRDSVIISVAGELKANVVSPDSVYTCLPQGQLVAEQPLYGTGMWEVTVGEASIDDPSNPTTSITLINEGAVTVTWTVSNPGCPASIDVTTLVHFNVEFDKLPNVITPNSDGKNDSWIIGNINRVPNSVRVYNRWGDLVFDETDYKNNWSGGGLSPGVYYYLVQVNGCPNEVKGSLTIIH